MNADVYNKKNEKVGTVALSEAVFGVRWNPATVRQALLAYAANRRRPYAHAKGRGEVRGGGKKPWKQKGLGRARHGSIRSPIWVGGGVTHGPHKERDYSVKINKKMRLVAIKSALSKRFKDGEIKFIDDLGLENRKTKLLFTTLMEFLGTTKRTKKLDALVVPKKENETISRAAGNLVKTKVSGAGEITVYDVLNYKNILIEQDAIPALEARLLKR